jgi:cytochrome c oxidase subunit 4
MAEAHMDAGPAPHAAAHEEGQQHPIRIYLIVWFWLFVLSACSYLVDIAQFQGYLRWGLILLLMFAKAGLIIAVFMHMVWERAALAYAIIVPPVVLLVFLALMASEADYTFLTRVEFFGAGPAEPAPVVH